MISTFLLLFSLLFQIPSNPKIVECLDEERFIAFAQSMGGEIRGDVQPEIAIDNLTGVPIVWDDGHTEGYHFLAERMIFAADGDVHYLYFLSNDENILVLVLEDYEVDAPDYQNPHGCGAFDLDQDVDWLTQPISKWKRGRLND